MRIYEYSYVPGEPHPMDFIQQYVVYNGGMPTPGRLETVFCRSGPKYVRDCGATTTRKKHEKKQPKHTQKLIHSGEAVAESFSQGICLSVTFLVFVLPASEASDLSENFLVLML